MPSERVYAVVSAYDHADLLPHFLQHYARLGVTRVLVSARGEEVWETAERLARDYPARATYTPAERFADSDRAAVEERLLDAEGLDADDWVMHLDLDEFHEYPAPLADVVREMNAHDDWALRGWIVDRVAADGRLAPVAPFPSIWEQFPIMANVTDRLLGAATQEIMICRRRVRLQGGVKHDTENAYYDRVPFGQGSQYRVHHFKWLEGLDRRLERRLAYDAIGDIYRGECERFLAYYRVRGRIDLSDPRLGARRSPTAPIPLTA